LEKLSEPGQICISRAAYDQLVDKCPFEYEYMGEKKVKNMKRPLHAYMVYTEPKKGRELKAVLPFQNERKDRFHTSSLKCKYSPIVLPVGYPTERRLPSQVLDKRRG
jgi:hypothetical protein